LSSIRKEKGIMNDQNVNPQLKEAVEEVMRTKGITDPNLAYPHVALQNLRKGKKTFQWHIVTLLACVVYVYGQIAAASNWKLLLMCIAYWAVETIAEQINALVYHFTKKAPLWCTPGHNSAYVIYIGLNIEITFMFGIAAAVCRLTLPENHADTFLYLPLNVWIPMGIGIFCLFVETLLNKVDALTWYWPIWNRKMLLFCLIGYSGAFVLFVQVYLYAQFSTAVILCASAVTVVALAHIILTRRKMI